MDAGFEKGLLILCWDDVRHGDENSCFLHHGTTLRYKEFIDKTGKKKK